MTTTGRGRRPSRIALVLLLCLPALAPAQPEPERFAELIEASRFEQAYSLALAYRNDLEGELLFDFYYGVAAIRTGRVHEGVFALERVIARRPGFARARLELARGYFLLEEDRRAREHFEAALAQEPPAPVAATIEDYLQAMRRRADRYSTVVRGHLEIGGGYDTNVNSATSADTVDSVLGPLVLDDAGKAREDAFTRLAGGVEVSRPVSGNATVFAMAGGESRAHPDEDDFDIGRVDGRVGTVLHGARTRTTLALRAQRFYVAGESYQDLVGVSADLRYRLSGALAAHGGIQIAQLGYEDQEVRDSTLSLLSAGLTRVWGGQRLRPVGSVVAFGGSERAEEDAGEAIVDRDLLGINGLLRLRLAPDWDLTGRAQYRRSEYAEEQPIFGTAREDDYYELGLDLAWEPSAAWRVGPSLRHSENDANIEVHAFERTVLELRARYSFY